MEDIILEFKKKYWKEIKKRPNVHGYSGILHPRIKGGKEVPGTRCIRIYVEKKVPAHQLSLKEMIPRALDLGGSIVEIDVVELPRMRYLDEPEDRTTPIDHQKRYRPVQAGTSCMHRNGTACTLSWYFWKGNKLFIALNCHCGALENTASIGDEWLQPSPYDGGVYPRDTIAKLSFYVPTKYETFKCPVRNFLFRIFKVLFHITHFRAYEPTNHVDISFGEPISRDILSFKIFGIEGKITGKGKHVIGAKVYKSGRTTGVTEGVIVDPAWNGYVYGRRGKAWYEDCVLVKGKCAGGDSGSPTISKSPDGLLYHGALFAGSDEFWIYCKVENIEREANVKLATHLNTPF